ncbi:MAG: hypothetical protein RLY31_1533 [Bacteroidota bacterium]|jgi:aminoglycoside phosphotransferase family enzyme
MTQQEINRLLATSPSGSGAQLIATHASWVLLIGDYAYKIKRPVRYSFLDYTTLALRKAACEAEVRLNRRLTDIYLDVAPVVRTADGRIRIGGPDGEIIDYAVRMVRVDPDRQMDVLLDRGAVTTGEVRMLAARIAAFHQAADISYEPYDQARLLADFADLETAAAPLAAGIPGVDTRIRAWTGLVEQAIPPLAARFRERVAAGFVRDGHGDLHCRNIFLLASPVIFDCIEFSEHFRINDVLSEIAFLAMDLDLHGRPDLTAVLLDSYQAVYPCLLVPADRIILTYFQLYRAGVRLKIAGLRLAAVPAAERAATVTEAQRLADLCDTYARSLAKPTA